MISLTQEKAIRDLAKLAAEAFVEEFPGETLRGDWDSEAWAIAQPRLSIDVGDEAEAWDIYRTTLSDEISRS